MANVTECPVLLPKGSDRAVLPAGGGATVEVHTPEWKEILIDGKAGVRCVPCGEAHVGHKPAGGQHARYIEPLNKL